MNTIITDLRNRLKIKSDAKKTYRALQKHLNTMPIGYPSTPTGVELRLLEHIFTTEEALAALNLSWRLETFEEIFQRARHKGYSEGQFLDLLNSMAAKGGIFSTTSGGQTRYACQPLVFGMFDMQVRRLTPNYYLSVRDYFLQGFTMEYLTSKVRQMRVIPIRSSLIPQLSISAYDDIRQIVDRTKDSICVADCICKTSMESVGKPCRATDRRGICIFLRDFHDIFVRNGWGRSISKQEAYEILDQNEKDGLVLMPSSLREPQVVCSCCGCCCGIISMVSVMPRAVDFVESNYRAKLNTATCTGCGTCQERCLMQAVISDGAKPMAINERRCIGCGLCVTTCQSNSLSLVRKEKEFVPPKDLEELYTFIDKNKKGTLGKFAMMSKAFRGREV